MKLAALLSAILAFGYACSDSTTEPNRLATDEIAFVSSALSAHALKLRITDAAGTGTPRVLADTFEIIYNFSWSPDGERIAYDGLDRQFKHFFAILSVSAGTETRFLVGDGGNAALSDEHWSPDGRFVARAEWSGLLEVMAPDGSGRRALATRVIDFVWARNGEELIVVTSPNGPTMPTSYLRINPATGDSIRIMFPRGGGYGLAVAPDGQRFAYGNRFERSIVISTLDGREIRDLRDNAGASYMRPRWSPNGHWIVVERASVDSIGESHLTLVRLEVDGPGVLTVARDLRDQATAQWSADSKRIAYSRKGPDTSPPLADAPAYIHIVDADGRNDRVISMPPSFSYKPKWRPVGK